MSQVEWFDRYNGPSYRNTAGAVASVRCVAEVELNREPADLFIECAQRRGLVTPTAPAVQLGRFAGAMKLALVPRESKEPAFFDVNWGTDSRRAVINLFEYFKAASITVPKSEFWRVPVTLQKTEEQGWVLVLHLDERTVQPVQGKAAPTPVSASACASTPQ